MEARQLRLRAQLLAELAMGSVLVDPRFSPLCPPGNSAVAHEAWPPGDPDVSRAGKRKISVMSQAVTQSRDYLRKIPSSFDFLLCNRMESPVLPFLSVMK